MRLWDPTSLNASQTVPEPPGSSTRPGAASPIALRIFVGLLCALLVFPAPVVGQETQTPSPEQQGPPPPPEVAERQLSVERPAAPIVSGNSGGGAVPNGAVDKRREPAPESAPRVATELPELRSEFGKVTAKRDGTFVAEYSAGRIHYQDSAGKWQPIETSLVSDDTDGFALRTKANDRVVRLATTDPANQLAQLTSAGVRLRMRVPGLASGDVTTASDAVLFPSITEAGMFSVAPTPEGFEFKVVLDRAGLANTYQVVLDTGGLNASLGSDGRTLVLTDAAGKSLGLVTAPWLSDADGREPGPEAVTVTVLRPGEVPPPADLVPSPSSPEPAPTATPSLATADPSPSPGSLAASPVPAPSASPAPGTSPAADPSTVASLEPTPAPSPTPSPTTAPSASPSSAPVTTPPVLGPTEVLVTYTIDPIWLSSPDRAYPVVLDPTVTVQPNGTGTDSCDSTATNYKDNWISSGLPNNRTCWSGMRIGYDNETESPTAYSFGNMRGLFWFQGVTLGGGDSDQDGDHITSATFSLYKYYGSARTLKTGLITGPGWSSPARWSDQQGEGGTNTIQYLCSNGASTNCDAAGALYAPSATTSSTNDTWFDQDVTTLVRRWYTRNANDWKANLGLMTKMATESSTNTQNKFRNGIFSTTSLRPKLVITYVEPKVKVGFDTRLGQDFVPSTLPAGRTISLPVKVKNNGSAFAFNITGSDYYRFGYRWFDGKGKPVSQTGFTNYGLVNLPAEVRSPNESAVFSLPVTAPPAAGQYVLRLDLVHVVNGVNIWSSDWAKPSLYYARQKDILTSSNTRWNGASDIERAEFPMAVVTGQGAGVGETKSVELPDNSSIGINLWSANLAFEGSGGVEFADLATDLELSYSYNSAERTNCTGILQACGWATNFDESFDTGTNGADYTYQDPDGNRYLVSANATGQLVSAAPVRIDRVRHTVIDENALSPWTGTAPTTPSGGAYSGSVSHRVAASNLGTTSTGIKKVPVPEYPVVSFAVKGETTGGAAVGFRIHNDSDSTKPDVWLCYTVGTDFTVSGCSKKIALGGSISGSWHHVFQRLLSTDAVNQGIVGAYDDFSVTGIGLYGNGSSGYAYFDAVRFEGRATAFYDETLPAFESGGSYAALDAADRASGQYAIRVNPASVALSPEKRGLNSALYNYPYARWQWKKVGGQSIAHVFTLLNTRTNATGSLTYYAGPTPPPDAPNPVQVAAKAPGTWTSVTRNLLEDARQILGFYNDVDTSGGTSVPNGGPLPDNVKVTAYKLVALDGNYALFDDAAIHSIPHRGDEVGRTSGADFVVTLAGGEEHKFNRDGLLTRVEDSDNNAVVLDWTYNYSTRVSTLAAIRGPADGQALADAAPAEREIEVTYPTNGVRFTERLGRAGDIGRYTEFVRSGTPGDLTAVVPARRSAACAAGATGCLRFAYSDTTNHRLSRVYDPRDTGSGSNHVAVTYNASLEPTKITAAATGTDLLRVLSYNAAGGSYLRPEWQDADGILENHARYTDLSPNGSVLSDYRPLPCANADCGGGTTSPAAPVDLLAKYETDGIDHYSKETRYRLASNGAPVVTRRGTFAAAKVDNYVDPLTANLTAWTQTAEQYDASVDSGDVDRYRTSYEYSPLQEPTRISTPFVNPNKGTTGVDPVQTLETLYDAEGHATQVSDDTFLRNGRFEINPTTSGNGWSYGSTIGWETGTPGSNGNVHGGFGSLCFTHLAYVRQDSYFLPGQTLRFQFWAKAGTSGVHATYAAYYWHVGYGTWIDLVPTGNVTATEWTQKSFDLTLPPESDGRVRVSFWNDVRTGTSYFDDAALFTLFRSATYTNAGLVATETDILNRIEKTGYSASSVHPAIFGTSTTENFVEGGPALRDQNAASTSTYDAWGRELDETDADSVTTTTTYAANRTDVASVADGLGNRTRYTAHDEIGNVLTELDPLDRSTTTSYSYFGDEVEETAPDGTKAHTDYDGVGRPVARFENYATGSSTTGQADIKTTFDYDAFGHVTREIEDAGVSDVYIDTTYDLLGNVTSTKVYTEGTTGERTTTSYFNDAGEATGTAGPIAPSSTPAPVCPNSSPAAYCNEVDSVDLNGRVTSTTDAYGKVTTSWYDFAGKPVRTVENYVAGGASTADQNVSTVTYYDTAGRLLGMVDPLGRGTWADYDRLDRITRVSYDDGSWARTDYTAGGRVDLASRPRSLDQSDNDVSWTKHVYDAAGRLTTNLRNYDRFGDAQLQTSGLESGGEGWSGASTGHFLLADATATTAADTADPRTGTARLKVTTHATLGYSGVSRMFSGNFVQGRTYRIRASLRGPAGTDLEAYLGVDAATGSFASLSPALALDGTWQTVEFSWTPTASASSNVRVAFRKVLPGTIDFYVDDVSVWDTSTPDRNIPTTTVYDPAGRVVASILPPAHAGDASPVTRSAYDEVGQLTSVTVNTLTGAGTGASDTNLTTSYTYDDSGNRTAETSPAGIATRFEYDRRGNLLATTLNHVSGGATSATENVRGTFAYNDRDELIAACTPERVQSDACAPIASSASAWRYAYDAAGHVVSETPPENATATALSTTTFVYDTSSGGERLTRSCDHPAGGSCSSATRYIDYGYDALGRTTTERTLQGAPAGTERLKTVNTYDAAGQLTALDYFENASTNATDSLSFGYDERGRKTTVSRGGTAVTTAFYNADGTIRERIDHEISPTESSFTYNAHGQLVSASSPTFSGSVGYSWRLDNLIATRSWPNGNTAAFSYDAAKRPVSYAEQRSGTNQAQFSRTYNRSGDVTSETQTLAGISGNAGNNVQSFTYDRLRRVTGATIGSLTKTYEYDADSNRTKVIDGGVTTTYRYDRTDELLSKTVSGVTTDFTYDAYGNMTTSAVSSAGTTGYTYDLADHLTGLSPPSGGAVSFTVDALGRHRTRSVAGALTDTYHYLGDGETIVRIVQPDATIDAAVDGAGSRIATKTSGGAFGWLLPDLHGNVAAAVSSDGTAVTDAFRYDAYGQLLDKTTSVLPSPWRYQGRLLLSTPGNTDLYDFVARAYDPGLGVFTSLDEVAGQAQNPITFNRFLYALADPATIIDPDGHFGFDPFGFVRDVASNGANFAVGLAEGTVDTVKGTLEGGVAVAGGVVNAGGCALNSGCRSDMISSAQRSLRAFARDPIGHVRSAGATVVRGAHSAISGTVNRVSTAWRTGNFRELGRVTAEVASYAVPGGLGVAGKALRAARGLSNGGRVASVVRASSTGSRAGKAARSAVPRARPSLRRTVERVSSARPKVRRPRGAACVDSFAAATLVLTASGAVAISDLRVGDNVLAYDEATAFVGTYPVTEVHVNDDPATGTVVIDGESIGTTPEHPFYTAEAGWTEAEDLAPGDRVRTADGGWGVVNSVAFDSDPAVMYNLTVATAHTFFVGEGEWLVHNSSCPLPRGGTYRLVDRHTREVVRTGRTKDLLRRRREHRAHPLLGQFEFQIDLRTDEDFVQRGREQIIHNVHSPRLNQIRPISKRIRNRGVYLAAARRVVQPRQHGLHFL